MLCNMHEGDQHIGLAVLRAKQALVALGADNDDHIRPSAGPIVGDVLPPDRLGVSQ